MCGVRDQDLRALRLAALPVVGAHHQQRGQLALGARRGLQRHGREAADLGQPALERVQDRQVALHGRRVLQRVRLGEAGQAGHALVELRVVLHGARAERVEAAVDAEVALRQPQVVAHHVELRELGEAVVAAHELRGQRLLRHVAGGQIQAGAAGDAELVQGRLAHARPPAPAVIAASARTSASTSERRCSSVTATSM